MSSSSVFGLCLNLLIGSYTYCYFICLKIWPDFYFSDGTSWVWDQVKVSGLPQLISLSILFPSDKNSLCFLLQLNYFFLFLNLWKLSTSSPWLSPFLLFSSLTIYTLWFQSLSPSHLSSFFSQTATFLWYFSVVQKHIQKILSSLCFNTEIEVANNAFQNRAC